MKPAALRKSLDLTRAQLARALGVNERTVTRWEDGTAEPLGLAAEVIAGITDAINDGADPQRVGISLTNGIRRLVCRELSRSSTDRSSPSTIDPTSSNHENQTSRTKR